MGGAGLDRLHIWTLQVNAFGNGGPCNFLMTSIKGRPHPCTHGMILRDDATENAPI
jgi:hypothetical protein